MNSTKPVPPDSGTVPSVVLASASPRRSELLAQIGLSFVVMPTDIDESEHVGEDPVSYVHRLAIDKARRGAMRHR